MDQLTAKFMPRFATLARARLATALQIANAGEHDRADGVAHDLHAIAGEAGLLGLDAVLRAAQVAEAAAREFRARGGEASSGAAFVACLETLERAVTEAATPYPSS